MAEARFRGLKPSPRKLPQKRRTVIPTATREGWRSLHQYCYARPNGRMAEHANPNSRPRRLHLVAFESNGSRKRPDGGAPQFLQPSTKASLGTIPIQPLTQTAGWRSTPIPTAVHEGFTWQYPNPTTHPNDRMEGHSNSDRRPRRLGAGASKINGWPNQVRGHRLGKRYGPREASAGRSLF